MTTIQTIKEAEEKFDEKLPNILHEFQIDFNKKDVFRNDLPPLERRAIKQQYSAMVKSNIAQTLLAVFESELEEIGDVGGEFTGFENDIEWGTKIGRSLERQKLRSHLTEVINYLKQK